MKKNSVLHYLFRHNQKFTQLEEGEDEKGMQTAAEGDSHGGGGASVKKTVFKNLKSFIASGIIF